MSVIYLNDFLKRNMECYMKRLFVLFVIKLLSIRLSVESEPSLKFECTHIFGPMEIPLNAFIRKTMTFAISNSSLTTLLINSPCCHNISIKSDGTRCSECAGNGIKMCYVYDKEVSINPIPDACLNESHISLSCTAQLCPEKISVNNTTIFRPGESTGCLHEGEAYECTKYGNWTKSTCTPEETSTFTPSAKNETSTLSNFQTTWTEKSTDTTVTSRVTPTTYSVTTDWVLNKTDSPINETKIRNQSDSNITKPTDTTTVDSIINMTEKSKFGINESTNELLRINETESTKEPINSANSTTLKNAVLTTDNNERWNETSTQNIFDSEQAMKDLYTFLIVLGVVLFLVFVLVCGFFIRKQKDKISITHVDYPLEYWHDQEYIDNIVEKSYTPKSAFTVNPMYGGGKDTPTNSQTRYKKKDESDYKSRRKAPNERGNNGGSEHQKKGNATRKRSNESNSDRSNYDRPRKTKHDYADKYVATAVGSNFYSYSQTQSEDVIKKTTDLDLSTEDEGNNGYTPNVQSGTGSFHPPRNGRKHRKSRAGSQQEQGYMPDNPYHDVDLGDYDNYAVVYKDRLRRGLEDVSAEESDV